VATSLTGNNFATSDAYQLTIKKKHIGRLVHLVEETDWGVSHKRGNNVLEDFCQSSLELVECTDSMLTVAPKRARTLGKQSWHLLLPRFFRKKK